MANGHLSYYDTQEIEDIVNDFLDSGDIEGALEAVNCGLSQHPGDEFLEKSLIWILVHDHQAEKAEALFEKYKDDGSDMTARLQFSFDVLRGDYEKGMERFMSVLSAGKIEPIDFLAAIDEMFDALPKRTLLKHLKKLLPLVGTSNAEVLGRLGALLMDAGDLKSATKAIEKALDIDAYDIYCWQDLAKCYHGLEKNKKCHEACDFGLAIEPENPLLNLLYVVTAQVSSHSQSDWMEQLEHLNHTRMYIEGRSKSKCGMGSDEETRRYSTITYELLFQTYLALDMEKEAKECMDIAIARTPENEDMFVDLITLLMEKGDQQWALKIIDKVLKHNPDNLKMRLLKVSVLASCVDIDQAYEALVTLSNDSPDDEMMLLARAELARKLKKAEDTDVCYRKLLAMHPKSEIVCTMMRFYFTEIGDNDALEQIGN